MNNENTVEALKGINFVSLPLKRKIEIRDRGRPKPQINLVQTSKCKSRDFKRIFKCELYEKNDWLCGCCVTNRLFCFPCLLFGRGIGEASWSKTGVADLGHLGQKMKKHENYQSHINAQLELKLLGKINIRQQLDGAFIRNIQYHNAQVKKNRYVLSKIIDCIKFYGAFELGFQEHKEGDDSCNPGIFKGLIDFTSKLDVAFRDYLKHSSLFTDNSQIMQNGLLDCMLEVYQENIKKEIRSAKFIAIMVDEIADVSSIFQMVVVFRYVLPNGTPVERFWSFTNPPTCETAGVLADSIRDISSQVIDNPVKLISQSYDGINGISDRNSTIQTLLQKDYEYGFYVHCYAHQLHSIISQVTSRDQEVRVFFSNLSDVANFFSNNPQRIATLGNVVNKEDPLSPNNTRNFETRTIVSTVYESREMLIDCMERITSSSQQTSEINQATALFRMLQDSNFVFWLTVFSRLMPHVGVLSEELQTTTDASKIRMAVEFFENSIRKESENMGTIGETEVTEVLLFRKRRKIEDPYIAKIVAAREICDIIISHVKDRFSFTGHLDAAFLLLPNNFEQFEETFPSQQLDATVNAYPFFDKDRLQSELEIIYNRIDFRNISGAVNLLKCIIENDLHEILFASFLLLLIIITIPMTTTEADRCFSTLNRAKTFLGSTLNQDRLTALAMLYIEKNTIEEIVDFNERVIDKYAVQSAQQNDFLFKLCI